METAAPLGAEDLQVYSHQPGESIKMAGSLDHWVLLFSRENIFVHGPSSIVLVVCCIFFLRLQNRNINTSFELTGLKFGLLLSRISTWKIRFAPQCQSTTLLKDVHPGRKNTQFWLSWNIPRKPSELSHALNFVQPCDGYVSHGKKKTALLSIKYCLFTRDPYNGL